MAKQTVDHSVNGPSPALVDYVMKELRRTGEQDSVLCNAVMNELQGMLEENESVLTALRMCEVLQERLESTASFDAMEKILKGQS